MALMQAHVEGLDLQRRNERAGTGFHLCTRCHNALSSVREHDSIAWL